MDDFTDIPQVPTYVKRAGDGVWDLFVLCPFCGDRHLHGGGSDEPPDLGPRVSHCLRSDLVGDYVLVPGPTGMTKPVAQTRGWRSKQWRAGLDGMPPIAPAVNRSTLVTASQLHRALLDRGFYLRVGEGDELIVSPCAQLTPQDCQEIRRYNDQLVILVKGPC